MSGWVCTAQKISAPSRFKPHIKQPTAGQLYTGMFLKNEESKGVGHCTWVNMVLSHSTDLYAFYFFVFEHIC